LQLGRYLVRTLIDRISAILARELRGRVALGTDPGSRKLQQTQRPYTTIEVKAAVD
jgi:hypothetical protein